MTRHFCKALWTSLFIPWVLGAGCKTVEHCGDGIDNDDDDLIDCADFDCQDYYDADFYGCVTEESDCSDGVDEDYDSAVDCEDTDCSDDPDCEGDGSGGSENFGGGSSSGGAPATGGTPASGGASGGSTGGRNESGAAGEGGEGSGGGEGTSTCPTPIEAEEGAGYVDVGALADFSDFTASSCQADGSGADIPLFYVVPADGTLTVMTYSTYGDTDVSVRSDCDDPDSELPLACAADLGTGMQETIELSVDAEQTVFIIVSGANAAVVANAYLQVVLD